MVTSKINIKDINFRVIATETLSSDDLVRVRQLFNQTYHHANFSYLEKSFKQLRYISFADYKGELVGFGVADAVETTLPRITEPQIVLLGGICCVASTFRRLGLFTELEKMSVEASDMMRPAPQYLVCGRMAHPASFRVISQTPAVIPKPGVRLSKWQQEIGLKVAELYGVKIDPETLVVIGNGTPCGYPKVKSEVSEEEWQPFKAVNRNQGDSLLGITWILNIPPGWLETNG